MAKRQQTKKGETNKPQTAEEKRAAKIENARTFANDFLKELKQECPAVFEEDGSIMLKTERGENSPFKKGSAGQVQRAMWNAAKHLLKRVKFLEADDPIAKRKQRIEKLRAKIEAIEAEIDDMDEE